jgi:ABC-type dipeptide/oligopeptide/nickel transport system ATPase subunit
MSVINIRKAEREGARLVLGIAGISGSGKTYTALQLAYGLANFDASKVGFLDTENRRGSLYANALKDANGQVQQFWIGDLYAPFSPQRYIDAILEFQRMGVEVLVIDSITHEWEGQGGCEEIAHAGNPRMPDWKRAKAEHKRFMNAMLQSDMHVIACIRAREKVKVEKVNGKSEVIPIGIQPVTEKNVMFEMTASMMMMDAGRQREVIKTSGTDAIFGPAGFHQGYLTPQHGKMLRDWVDGAKALDPRIEHAKNSLRTVCEQGMEALAAAWKALPQEVKQAIGPSGCPDEFKLAAKEFDALRAKDSGRQLDDLNKQVLGDGAQDAA